MKNNLNDYMEHLIESYSIQENKSPWDQLNEAILSESAENHLDPNMTTDDFIDDSYNYDLTFFCKTEEDKAKYPFKYKYPLGANEETLPEIKEYLFKTLGMKKVCELTSHTGKMITSGYIDAEDSYYPEFDMPDVNEVYLLYAKEEIKLFAKLNNIPEEECLNNKELLNFFIEDAKLNSVRPEVLEDDMIDEMAILYDTPDDNEYPDEDSHNFDGYESLNESDSQQNHLDSDMEEEDFLKDLDNYREVDALTFNGKPTDLTYKYNWDMDPELSELIYGGDNIGNIIQYMGYSGEITSPAYNGDYWNPPEAAEFDIPTAEEVYDYYVEAVIKEFAKYNNIDEAECLNNKELVRAIMTDIQENGFRITDDSIEEYADELASEEPYYDDEPDDDYNYGPDDDALDDN